VRLGSSSRYLASFTAQAIKRYTKESPGEIIAVLLDERRMSFANAVVKGVSLGQELTRPEPLLFARFTLVGKSAMFVALVLADRDAGGEGGVDAGAEFAEAPLDVAFR